MNELLTKKTRIIIGLIMCAVWTALIIYLVKKGSTGWAWIVAIFLAVPNLIGMVVVWFAPDENAIDSKRFAGTGEIMTMNGR